MSISLPAKIDRHDSQKFTDDGIRLTPVDGGAEMSGLEVIPIEPPPFPASRPRRRTGRVSERAETTSMPDADDERAVLGQPDKPTYDRLEQTNKDAQLKVQQVFGVDSRVLYTPTNVFPNRAVCKLLVRYPFTPMNLLWAGTGSFIGSKHVLTAGHVLYKASEGGWAQWIRVVPGMDGNTWWFGSEVLVWPNFKQRSVAGWTEDMDIDYDYGMITLNTGFSVGSFGLLYASNSTLDSTTAYILGYPTSKGSPAGSQQFGVPSGGGITDHDSTLVYYAIDTSGGQSGAGVYRFWKGKRAIVAVHGGQFDSDENRGARITKFRHDQIRAWQKADA